MGIQPFHLITMNEKFIISHLPDTKGKNRQSVPSDMKNGIIRNDYVIQQQRITDTSYFDFVDQNVEWGTLHDILHVAKKETLRG